MSVHIDRHMVPNHEGWLLPLKRTVSHEHLDPSLPPVLILPGYGMNAYIFGWPEDGNSMERVLAECGLEVWSGGMRRQGDARKVKRRAKPPSLRAYAEVDLTVLTEEIVARTHTDSDVVDVIGASLGGAVVYGHLALVEDNVIGSVVSMGAPLRWEAAHPALKVAFRSRRLAKFLPMMGTDRLARAAFPLIANTVPQALSIYMNLDHVDMDRAHELTRTVDEPHRIVNRDIASWVRHGDMVLAGVNISDALRDEERPLLVIYANADGIVPPDTATSVVDYWGGEDVTVWPIGTEADWYAHADLFIAPESPAKVFRPMAKWLRERSV